MAVNVLLKAAVNLGGRTVVCVPFFIAEKPARVSTYNCRMTHIRRGARSSANFGISWLVSGRTGFSSNTVRILMALLVLAVRKKLWTAWRENENALFYLIALSQYFSLFSSFFVFGSCDKMLINWVAPRRTGIIWISVDLNGWLPLAQYVPVRSFL